MHPPPAADQQPPGGGASEPGGMGDPGTPSLDDTGVTAAPEPVQVRIPRWVLVVYAVVVAAMTGWGQVPAMDGLYLGVLALLMPALAILQLGAVDRTQIDTVTAYGSTMVTLVVLAIPALVLGWRWFGLGALGLGTAPGLDLVAWTLILIAAGMAVLIVSRALRFRFRLQETDFLETILPRTPRERRWFVGVSLVAGVCEEIVYRGYLISALATLTPDVWTALILSTLLFAVVHAYQGWFGILRTAVLGFLLGLSFVLSGTLWPAILAHVAINLLAGLVVTDYLTANPPTTEPA